MAKICKVYSLYSIDDPNNLVYIGQSVDVKRRFKNHLRYARKRIRKSKLYSWIISKERKGYNIKYKILNYKAIWNKSEIYYINKLNPKLNMTEGGEGTLGHKLSEQHIKKILESKKGYKHSKETKIKISIGNKKRKRTKEEIIACKYNLKKYTDNFIEENGFHPNKIHCKGRIMTEETKLKMSIAHKGKKIPNRKPFSDEYKIQHSIRIKEWWKKRKAA